MNVRHPRLDQLFSQLGYGSRRDAREFLTDGRLSVDGVAKPTVDLRVDPALVRVDGEPLDNPAGLLLLLNKPLGYVCTHDEREGASVYELLPERWRQRSPQVVSVGRLDKDTSGLLLLTDRHELVHTLTSPKHHVEKEYEAVFEGTLPIDAVARFAAGTLMLKDETKPCLPARLEILGSGRARVVLTEGRYHQVRRMFAALGTHVTTLERRRFGALKAEGLESGRWRLLPVDSAAFSVRS